MRYLHGAALAAASITAAVPLSSSTAHATSQTAPEPTAQTSATINSAKVGSDGLKLTVNVTYTCQTTTETISVSVAAGQPTREQTKASGGKYERIGAGAVAAVCDGKAHTVDVPALPQRSFTGTWKTGANATVGVNLLRVVDNKATLLARDSKDMALI
ncbi:hypothetical protein ACQEU3_38980 [Spirillospora sp. CA-253888]